MQRLIPTPTSSTTDMTTSIEESYAAPLGTHPDRPWVGLSMVASIDGSTVVAGKSAGLSSENDSGVLLQLRSIADVILVGAGTVRGEGYGPPSKPGQRIGVITGSGSVDTSTELFTSGAGFVITTTGAEIDNTDVDIIRAGDSAVDLASVLQRLGEVCVSSAFVQVEGGATLNAAFGDADLFDELNITTSPATVAGSGHRLFNDGDDHAHRYELAQVVVDDQSFVFSRWVRVTAPTSP